MSFWWIQVCQMPNIWYLTHQKPTFIRYFKSQNFCMRLQYTLKYEMVRTKMPISPQWPARSTIEFRAICHAALPSLPCHPPCHTTLPSLPCHPPRHVTPSTLPCHPPPPPLSISHRVKHVFFFFFFAGVVVVAFCCCCR